jgi:hypothetical protein
MERHFGILIKIFLYVVYRYQIGNKLSIREKHQIITGLFALFSDFFSRYTVDESELGKTRMEVPALGDVRVPGTPLIEYQVPVHEVLQEPPVRPAVPEV